MSVQYEPEFGKALASLLESMPEAPKPRPDHLEDSVKSVAGFYAAMCAQLPDYATVERKIHYCTSKDGSYKIPIHHFFRKDLAEKPDMKSSAAIYIHGGGFITGSVELLRRQIEARVHSTGVPFFAVDYRLAPEYHYPKQLEDAYSTLSWVRDHVEDFNIDKSRIGLYGESAGGNLAAAVALLARDEALSPPLAKQILIYPMLDDKNITAHPVLEPFATWTHQNNILGWKAMLGDAAGSDSISAYAAPARATSLKGLPSTYMDVGTMDIFLDEDIEYAQRLLKDGVDVELHVLPNVPHGHEGLAPKSKYGVMTLDSRDAAIKSF